MLFCHFIHHPVHPVPKDLTKLCTGVPATAETSECRNYCADKLLFWIVCVFQ